MDHYTHRPSPTLGVNYRDIYRNGKLFASQVDREVANWFCRHPEMFAGNVSAGIEKMRSWVMEQEYRRAVHAALSQQMAKGGIHALARVAY